MDARDRICVALDVSNLDEVKHLVCELAPDVGCFKIGLELVAKVGEENAVMVVQRQGGSVFLDKKLHDIPSTVGEAVLGISHLGATMLTVHASGGIEQMRAAVKNKGMTKILAVTVLTSLDDNVCRRIYGTSVTETVFRFARDARQAKVDGIVSSPKELLFLNKFPEFNKLWKVTPGIRPAWYGVEDDQRRVMTPTEAIRAGADMLVIGRPITRPPKEIGSPVNAARLIKKEIQTALERRGNDE